MGGGLLQLVSYGKQNLYLSGNPQISFFKIVYRRHTNFSMESIQQIMYGSNGPEGTLKCSIQRKGDLLHKVYLYLEVTEPEDNAYLTYNNVLTMIDTVILYISGKEIVRFTGEWLNLWLWMCHNKDKYNILSQLALTPSGTEGKLFIPLPFWFCKDIGSSFPIIALQYAKLEIEVTYKSTKYTDYRLYEKCTTACLWCNYIYLDKDERNWFAKNKHVYLIEQVQHMKEELKISILDHIVDIPFVLPIKELIWMVKDPNPWYCIEASPNPIPQSTESVRQIYWNDGVVGRDQIESAILFVNHCERFDRRSGMYFRVVQFYEHHSGGEQCQHHCVYLYSFALEPEKLEPTGSCNFSKLDNPQIKFRLETYDTEPAPNATHNAGTKQFIMYGVNYNILIIENGLGALSYSN